MTAPPPLPPTESVPRDPLERSQMPAPLPAYDGAAELTPDDDEPASTPTIRRRLPFAPRSLTSKLVAGVVSLVFVIVCATGACTYLALRSELQTRLDQQLQTVAGSSPTALEELFSGGGGPGPGVQAQFVWAVFVGTDGRLLGYSKTGSIKRMVLAPDDLARLATAATTNPATVQTTGGTQLRVTSRIVPGLETSSGGPVLVLIGLDTGEEHRTLRQLVRLEIVIGAAALLVALFATTYGVQFSLRRLRRVTETAQEVASELSPDGAGLDRRVPVVEEGTEVGQLAESMNTLLSAVETQFAARVESENRMRQFLADASHELRTPLTSIRGYAELARMQRAAGDRDEDNLDRIESEGTRMSRLVEDLLLLARGDRDTIPRIELVDVADLIEDAVSGARAANPERTIDVDAAPSYNVVGDPDQLVRVIRNLLTNAVVHTPANSPIRVHAFVDGPGIAIQVIDGGPGLPPDEAAHVFERFWRADKARTRARGGSGLGLSIVATIVEAHQGATHFQSTVEGGSTVTVWLPGVST